MFDFSQKLFRFNDWWNHVDNFENRNREMGEDEKDKFNTKKIISFLTYQFKNFLIL